MTSPPATPRSWVAGSSSTAAATRRWTPRGPPSASGRKRRIIVYRRDRAHMKAQAFEAEEALEEGVKIKWLTSIKSLEGTDLTVEEMELGADGRPQPTGRLETLSADAVVLAVGQETDSGFLRKIPGIEFQSDGVVVVAPEHDDRPSGDLRRRRHGADRADGDRGASATARRRRATSTPGCAAASIDRPPSTRSFRSRCCTCRSTATRSDRCRGRCRSRSASPGSRRCRLASARRRRPTRRSAACPAATASSATSAMRPARSRRSRSSSPATGYRYLYDRCTGCAVCFDTCPCHAIEMIPEPRCSVRDTCRRTPTRLERSRSTATPRSRTSPTASTRSARSIRSRRPRRWPSSPTSGRPRA